MPYSPPFFSLGAGSNALRPVDSSWRPASELVRTGRPVVARRYHVIVGVVRYSRSHRFPPAVGRRLGAGHYDVHDALVALREVAKNLTAQPNASTIVRSPQRMALLKTPPTIAELLTRP